MNPTKVNTAADTREKIMEVVFLVATTVSLIAVALICLFIFANGLPAIAEIGPTKFLFGTEWKPNQNIYGILPMILASIYVTIGSIIMGVPIGILTAVYMAYYCPPKIYRYLKAGVNLMSGIPSVIYGLFGLTVIVPMIRPLARATGGLTMFTAMILLAIMILPTVIGLSEAALRAVPNSFYEAAVGLGATKERAVMTVLVPAASSGVLSSVVMGLGRSIGETMAVLMVAGNQPVLPTKLFQGIRTMTTNVVLEMGYAAGLHRDALIATGAVLFVFVLLINVGFNLIKKGGQE